MRARVRKLVGYLWRCEDFACNCTQPIIEEQWVHQDYDDWAVFSDPKGFERTWEGTWLSDPSPSEEEMLRDELAKECYQHRMVEDPLEPGRWEREI